MPRLNGKFVSQEVYDEAVANGETVVIPNEENVVSEENETATAKVDKRVGPRPGTELKKALIAKVTADHKLAMAESRLAAFDTQRDSLAYAVVAAQEAVDAATKAVEEAQANL